jgi:hypothetical protein
MISEFLYDNFFLAFFCGVYLIMHYVIFFAKVTNREFDTKKEFLLYLIPLCPLILLLVGRFKELK